MGNCETAVHTSLSLHEPTRWVADRQRTTCKGCARRFLWPFVRRHHCRSCGEVFCHQCTQSRRPILRFYTFQGRSVRVCNACVVSVEADNERCKLKQAADRMRQQTMEEADPEGLTFLGVEVEVEPTGATSLIPYEQLGTPPRESVGEWMQHTHRVAQATSSPHVRVRAWLSPDPSVRSVSPIHDQDNVSLH